MEATCILQRLRFCNSTPPDASSPRLPSPFDPAAWLASCRTTYWQNIRSPQGIHSSPEGISIEAGSTISSDSFFNALFLSYWKQLTTIRTLGLTLIYEGHMDLKVIAIAEDDQTVTMCEQELPPASTPTSFSLTLPISISTTKAVRLAFELTSRANGSRLCGGSWDTTDKPSSPVSLGILIPTFNRPHYTRRTIARIFEDSGLSAEKIHVWLVEQSDHAELDTLSSERCHVFRQQNLGSTGGYTRALYECLRHEAKPTHVLFMDDDVDLETDSLLRSIRLLQFARQPFIIGGAMLDLYRPQILSNFGGFYTTERTGCFNLWDYLQFSPASTPEGLRQLSKPMLSDVGAWWFTIFPVSVVEAIGLPIPLFLKMDDVEYSVRARRQGVPLHMIPGIGLWHMPFSAKRSDAIDYYCFYNNLIINTQLGIELGRGMLRNLSLSAMKSIQDRQYRTAASYLRSMEDFVGGWRYFRDGTFPNRGKEIVQYLDRYPAGESPANPPQTELVDDLNRRLKNAFIQSMSQIDSIHADLAKNLPRTMTPDAWKEYFSRGNSTCLS